jgi:hypothetical protein
MATRIVLAAVLLVAAPAIAVAQSSTATSGTTKPLQSAPTAGVSQNPKEKPAIPPAARSGEKGLRVGEGAVTGDNPVEIKRVK